MTEIVMITTAATELAIQSDFEGFDVVPNTEIAVEANKLTSPGRNSLESSGI
jgi:hypothetical protein